MPSLPIYPLQNLGTKGDTKERANESSSFDFIIVGGGTSGCVIASRLSLLPWKPKVLLLERGANHHRGFQSNTPLLSVAWQSDPNKAYCIESTPQTGLNGRKVDLVGGKILGGTGRINSSLYTRGPPAQFNSWAKDHSLPSWSYPSLLPYFTKSQSHTVSPSSLPPSLAQSAQDPAPTSSSSPSTDPINHYAGTSGPWPTSTPSKILHPPVIPFIASAQSLGIPLVKSLNDPDASASAVGVHELTGSQGRKGSTMESYFFPADGSEGFGEGLRVGLGAVVWRVELGEDEEGQKRCEGVWFGEESDGEDSLYYASASKEVIITAGTLFSPQLLLLSGIGPRSELEELGIDCKVDLPGVGKGLTDHLGVYLPFSVPYAHSLDRIETSPLHATHQLLSYLTSKSGSFTFQGSQAAIFTSSSHIPTFLASPPPSSSSTSSAPAPQRPHSTTASPPLANPYSSANPLWTSSLDPAEIPDLEILPLPMRYHCSLDDGKPEGKTKDLRAGKYDKSKGYFTPIVVLVDPKSKGSVTVKSNDPRDEPVADPAFLSDPRDLAILTSGLKLAKRLVQTMASPPLSYPIKPHGPNYPFNDRESFPADPEGAGDAGNEEDDEGLEEYIRKWSAPCYHMSSTLPLSSSSNPLGVLNERLHVRGVRGLRVGDASVFPTVLAAHTQAAVVVVGEKLSAMVAEDWEGGERQVVA